jgi:hypothetical protein
MQAHERALNRLAKWRLILVGRILGTRPAGDPPTEGFRDIFDGLLCLRAELNALETCLIDRGTIGQQRLLDAIEAAANELNEGYERRFPGIRTTDVGVEIFDPKRAAETMRGWPA